MDITDKTKRGNLARTGAGVGRPKIDVMRMARALQGPGNDTRTWICAGTVGSADDGGQFDASDPDDIYADRSGVVVSVRLEPYDKIVTARWSGMSCGRYGFALFPIRPGDEVLVAFPDGDLNSPSATIFYAQANETAQIPSDWNNDRVLFDFNVPFEIRAPAVRIRSGALDLNNRTVVWGPEDI
jgi:hypothetical protein